MKAHEDRDGRERSPEQWRRLSWLAVLAPLAAYCLNAARLGSWLVDDAGISFAYARHVIHGYGVTAQVGAPPVEGFSNPLWTLLIAPLFVDDPVDPVPRIKLLSGGLVALTFVLVARTVHRLVSRDRAVLATATTLALLALNPSYVVWTTSGLENALYGALTAALAYLLLKWLASGCAWVWAAWVSVCSCLLAWTRPDGVLFLAALPLSGAALGLSGRLTGRPLRQCLAAYMMAVAVLMGPGLIGRRLYFGRWLTHTYAVKGGPGPDWIHGVLLLTRPVLVRVYGLLRAMFSRLAGPAMLGLPLTAAYLAGRRQLDAGRAALTLVTGLALLIYVLLPEDWMGEYRFATPFWVTFTPWLVVMTFVLLDDLVRPAGLAGAAQLVLALALAGGTFRISLGRLDREALRRACPASWVSFAGIAQNIGIRFNRYADRLGIDRAVLAVNDMGGTLYFSRHRVYDLLGLCDPRLARLRGEAKARYLLQELKPTFIHVNEPLSHELNLDSHPRFREEYAAITETPSRWALAEHGARVFDGDYVRRDAVGDPDRLESLRRDIPDVIERCREDFVRRRAQPFPRTGKE